MLCRKTLQVYSDKFLCYRFFEIQGRRCPGCPKCEQEGKPCLQNALKLFHLLQSLKICLYPKQLIFTSTCLVPQKKLKHKLDI